MFRLISPARIRNIRKLWRDACGGLLHGRLARPAVSGASGVCPMRYTVAMIKSPRPGAESAELIA